MGTTTFTPLHANADGLYLWSDPQNWSDGIPTTGDAVVIQTGTDDIGGSGLFTSTDDIPSLSLGTLTVGNEAGTYVPALDVQGVLSVETLTDSPLVFDGSDPYYDFPAQALLVVDTPSADLTVAFVSPAMGEIDFRAASGGSIAVKSDDSTISPDETDAIMGYTIDSGGTISISDLTTIPTFITTSGMPADPAVIELPGGTDGVLLVMAAGLAIELPGHSVTQFSVHPTLY